MIAAHQNLTKKKKKEQNAIVIRRVMLRKRGLFSADAELILLNNLCPPTFLQFLVPRFDNVRMVLPVVD